MSAINTSARRSSLSLVLASQSPYRRELLDRLGLPYQACAHQCDERKVPQHSDLELHAQILANAKAESLAERFPDSAILASDQVAEIKGEVLHKPGTAANARKQLEQLSGHTHRLITAVALRLPNGQIANATDIHRMTMRSLSAEEIHRYIEADSPLDCCGSYKIECLGISLFDSIDGNDFTAIVGLPLLSVCGLLRDAGFDLP